MNYIIVWNHRHREPFVLTNYNDFIESFSTYEEAKEEAEKNKQDSGYFKEYSIYQEVTE